MQHLRYTAVKPTREIEDSRGLGFTVKRWKLFPPRLGGGVVPAVVVTHTPEITFQHHNTMSQHYNTISQQYNTTSQHNDTISWHHETISLLSPAALHREMHLLVRTRPPCVNHQRGWVSALRVDPTQCIW